MPASEKTRRNERGKADTRPIEWDRDRILLILKQIILKLKADERIRLEDWYTLGKKKTKKVVVGYKYLYLGQLLVEQDVTSEYWSRWKASYKDDGEIRQSMGRVEEILKARSWEASLAGDVNPHIAKFHLTNNHGAQEKSITEHTGEIKGQTLLLRDMVRKAKAIKP